MVFGILWKPSIAVALAHFPALKAENECLPVSLGVCDQISAPPSDTALSTYFFPFSFLLILVVHVDVV